jgi:hypothetical protein
MSDPTDSLYIYTKKIQTIITDVQEDLGIVDIFYGDQQQIPRTPTVCIESDKKTRELQGAPRRVLNQLRCFVIVYSSRVDDTAQLNSEIADQLTEAIESEIHKYPTLDGLVFHSLVGEVESGFQSRLMAGKLTRFRASRLTVTGQSKTMLPMSPEYNQP